jgi:hypothetical protein
MRVEIWLVPERGITSLWLDQGVFVGSYIAEVS